MRRRGGEVTSMDPDALAALVDTEIGDRVRELLVQRGRAHAAITDLALALGDVEGKPG
jgi:hypothetical protein